MITINELHDNGKSRIEAEVWLEDHSHQAAYFDNRPAAERWADWLQKRIMTERLVSYKM